MRPFFTYYGGKWRSAPRYPVPRYDTIIEPFAGSAGYAVRHFARDVHLFDIDEKVVGTWDYLIHTPADEIRRLPLYDGTWESVDDLAIPQEARWLVGWWLNKGTAQPRKSPSAWMRTGIRPNSVWGAAVRERLADQVDQIRHWTVTQATYTDVPTLIAATWFVDPPYVKAGRHYRHGTSDIDFTDLGDWCQVLPGQVLVCENTGADWLPFEPFAVVKVNPSKRGGKRSAEALWTSNSGEADIDPLTDDEKDDL